MKRIIIVAIAIVLGMGTCWAQQGSASATTKKTAMERAEAFTKRMNKVLALDQTQLERVKVVNEERFKKLEEARSANTAQGEKASQVKTINENYMSTLKGVLSPEQFAKFQEMKEEMKEKAMARKGKK